MKKLGELSKVLAVLLAVVLFTGLFPTGTVANLKTVSAATTLDDPRIVADSSMETGQKVTWDCVWFGDYPQSEVTDENIYTMLKNATGWDENNDIVINGSKYRRLKGEDATYATSGSSNYYNWNDSYGTYHYFKYEPIKWRVLSRYGNNAYLLADIVLDDQRYNREGTEETNWETSSIRSWLNGYSASVNKSGTDYRRKNFINTAFTSEQKNIIHTVNIINNDSLNYAIIDNSNASDKVFLLSASEVYNTESAAKYGFAKGISMIDEARRSCCSAYAYAMGIYRYYSTDEGYEGYNGNVNWWLRSLGSFSSYAAGVNYSGMIDDWWEYEDRGVRPALHLNLTSSNQYSYAGTVCSNGTKNEVAAPDLKYENTAPSGGNTNKGNSDSTENANKNTDKNTNKNTPNSPSKPKPAASTTKKKPSNPIASLSGVLKSVKSPAKSTMAIKWKKLNKVTGYQVQLCSKSNFKKGTIQRTFKQKVTSTKVRPLKPKKKYYVRIRPYVKSGSKKYYGKWSKVKSVKIK